MCIGHGHGQKGGEDMRGHGLGAGRKGGRGEKWKRSGILSTRKNTYIKK